MFPSSYFDPGTFASAYFPDTVAGPVLPAGYFHPDAFAVGYFDPGYFPGLDVEDPQEPEEPGETYGTEVEAFVAHWTGTAALAALGPLYFVEAEEGTALPYFTIMLVSRDLDDQAGDLSVNRAVVQLSIHDRLPRLCESHAKKVRKAFHRAQLAIGSGANGHCLRGNEVVARGEGKAPEGKDCWMQMLDFEFLYSGSLDAE